ncbi:MAG: AzlD domain-containing protein [Bacilli bacterium]|nr:AzlD domain-containing protein [Bacilli bacterium]
MNLSNSEILILIVIMALVTFFTRLFPFLFFKKQKTLSPYITYIGNYLPYSLIAMLVVYCLKDVSFFTFPSLIPEIITIAAIVFLHIWKRNFLISIGVGTFLYMFLIQTIF